MRASVIGIQPSGGCTPFDAPSQFSQYPWSTLPAGLDLTAHVPEVGVGVGEADGVGVGEAEAEGDGETVGVLDGDGVLVPSQAPRSVHSEAAATGFQPAPGGGVCATRAPYSRPP